MRSDWRLAIASTARSSRPEPVLVAAQADPSADQDRDPGQGPGHPRDGHTRGTARHRRCRTAPAGRCGRSREDPRAWAARRGAWTAPAPVGAQRVHAGARRDGKVRVWASTAPSMITTRRTGRGAGAPRGDHLALGAPHVREAGYRILTAAWVPRVAGRRAHRRRGYLGRPRAPAGHRPTARGIPPMAVGPSACQAGEGSRRGAQRPDELGQRLRAGQEILRAGAVGPRIGQAGCRVCRLAPSAASHTASSRRARGSRGRLRGQQLHGRPGTRQDRVRPAGGCPRSRTMVQALRAPASSSACRVPSWLLARRDA